MNTPRLIACALLGMAIAGTSFAASAPDAGGNAAVAPKPPPVKKTRSGHVSNYDESKIAPYQLPDPLRLESGEAVRDAATWFARRRPEILRQYETQIYGRVPAHAPVVRTEVVRPGDVLENGAVVREHVVLHFGAKSDGPKADVVIYRPARATAPVPVLLQIVFFRGLPDENPEPPVPPSFAKAGRRFSETGPVEDILSRGYAYATFRYSDVQPDNKDTNSAGVQALAYAPGQTKPAPDEWGTIGAWAWGASRVFDYLATDKALDARRVALIGHSRLGKTVLWASAQDPRFALVFSSCSGEMGAALARRDYGESVDDMAENFPWQFAGNFQQYIGHWDQMPVDAHELIALSAPRPVFVSGGTEDQWADPKGEFLAEVAAGPVYRLLGAKDLGATALPPLDTPLINGDLGWIYHTGGHTITPGDWKAFLDFADRHLDPKSSSAGR